MLREVRLYGELGRLFGQVHMLAVKSAAEAVRALSINHPGFEAHLREHSEPGYRVWLGKDRIGADELNAKTGAQVIRIAPVTAGSKKGGMGQIVIGALLIAAAVVLQIITPGNPVSPYLFKVGAVMILGGVAQLLTPTPKKGSAQESEDKSSYSFSGPVNNIAQGNPVPVLYGEMIVGSAVISAGIYNEDIPL